ncbi:MAG TPA: hypothetical protein VM621_10450 [Luteibacter sp.]|nr:hypothetical protein [Luteibacter sp.]
MRNVTVGALVSVWGVMRTRGDRENADLICRGVDIYVLDDIADLPGFGEAMASSGWVKQTTDGIVFPGFFNEYNVDPATGSASANAERQRRYRDKKKVENVTESNVTRDVTVTHREEKSREEKEGSEKSLPISLPDWLPAELWADWHTYRNSRKGWTAKAKELSLKTLTELHGQGHSPKTIIERSIERGWTGLFAPAAQNGQQPAFSGPQKTRKELGV